MKNWNGLMKVLEIKHFSTKGELIYCEAEIKNILHSSGEEFILKSLFTGDPIPENYFIGLDNRSTPEFSNTISSLSGYEPTTNSYSRQSVSSSNFSIIEISGHKQANSPSILFKANGGSWGPVKNIFLCTNLGYGTNSKLISSAALSTGITVADGEVVTMRMGMALSSC